MRDLVGDDDSWLMVYLFHSLSLNGAKNEVVRAQNNRGLLTTAARCNNISNHPQHARCSSSIHTPDSRQRSRQAGSYPPRLDRGSSFRFKAGPATRSFDRSGRDQQRSPEHSKVAHRLTMSTSSPRHKVIGLVSGGKDSCFNLLHCVANGHDIVALATLTPDKGTGELPAQMKKGTQYPTIGAETANTTSPR